MTLCPCDHPSPPLLHPIAPSLSRLPRQIGLFGEFRADMLSRVRAHPALTDWRARDAEDFGVMLLEFWAYVCDVTSFYTAEHAQDAYLGTARDAAALSRIVALLDHIPRPAVASEAVLAALLDGSDIVIAPAGAGFLSDAIDGTPPQHYELTTATLLDPLRNGWPLLSPRDTTLRPDALLIDPATRNIAEGGMIVIDAGTAGRKATFATALTNETALDGNSYLRLELADPSALPSGASDISQIRLWSFVQTAPVASILDKTLTLAGHYPQLRGGDLVVVEDSRLDGPLAPEVLMLTSATTSFGKPIAIGTGTDKILALRTGAEAGGAEIPGPPITLLELSAKPGIPADHARLHIGRARAGRLAAPFRTRITVEDLAAGLSLKSPAQAPHLPGTGEVLVKGAADLGLRVPGDMAINPTTGRGGLVPSAPFPGGATTGTGELQVPILAHGNLLRVTRGKTVEEVLGSGQGPGVAFQSFRPTKFPLTFLYDSGAPGGRRSTLRLWIDGIEWTEIRNLFTAGPEDRVFTLRLDAQGKATITTGGEGCGMPAPLGVQNVFATYRFGAGDPPPGANRIRQIAGPVANLRRVFNVTPAFGGAPADTPEDIRFTAPATAAAFDRAISAADHAALARDWGALAASAVTEWVPDALRSGVVVTAIFSATPTAEDLQALQAHLAARAAEMTPIRIIAAEPVTGTLKLSYSPAPDASADKLRDALWAAFLAPFTGLLTPRQAKVGGPVFRSAILARAAQVPGMGELLSLHLNGRAMPPRLGLPAHGYFAPALILEEVPT